MQRRDFLSVAAMALGGVVYSRGLAALMWHTPKHLMTADDFIRQPVDMFSPQQRQVLVAAVERIIPATETPGAVEAGVPTFIEIMYARWMKDEERAVFQTGLSDLQARQFSSLSVEQQETVLLQWEEESQDHPWYQSSGTAHVPDTLMPFMALLKELTVFGFFMSEVGCKQVLRYNPMPGAFDGDIPLDSHESSWVPTPLM